MRLHLACALALVTTVAGCRPNPHRAALKHVTYAWWITVRFRPNGDSIAGIPIRSVDSTWTGALALNRAVLPPEAQRDPSSLADSLVAFTLDGDFNRDGAPDRALVGVYQTAAGATGRFLLILTLRGKRWQKADVLKEPGDPGFSVLTVHGDTLSWWDCMECDFGFEVAWNGHEYAVLPAV